MNIVIRNAKITPRHSILLLAVPLTATLAMSVSGEESTTTRQYVDPPVINSFWDNLLSDVHSPADWELRRVVLKQRYLELIRDSEKPKERLPLEMTIHDSEVVDQVYTRHLISYSVEAGERAHAYLGIPLGIRDKAPAIVALHGTRDNGKDRIAGLAPGHPGEAHLDRFCRVGYVVIAPDHFVAGHRIPREGSYDTTAFHQRHPNWTAVGKSTFEHSIAVDVLVSRPEVDASRIGTLGHSLGGHGAIFLAAYDERIKAAICNCGLGSFQHDTTPVTEWARDRWYSYLKHLRPGLLKGELPPIDFHEIIALIAPRAFMDISAQNDGDTLAQRQRTLMLMRIMDVYQLQGAADKFMFVVHGKGHSIPVEAHEMMLAFMNAQLAVPKQGKAAEPRAPKVE